MQMVGFLIAVSAVLSSGCSKSYFSLQQNSTQYLTLVIFVLQLWSLQECISQTEQVQRKHCYKLVPCIPSWLSQTARKCFLLLFFFSIALVFLTFSAPLCFISTFSLKQGQQ